MWSALALTIILLLIASGIVIAAIKLWSSRPSLETIGWLAAGCIAIGVLYGARRTIGWVETTVERPWIVEDDEVSRRRYLEDLDRARADVLSDDARQSGQASGAASFVHLPKVALEILRRHFTGQDTTRDGCMQDGICTSSDWNLVTGLFKRLGLKTGYKLDPGSSLIEAWTIWHDNVKVEAGQLWVRNDRGGWSLVE